MRWINLLITTLGISLLLNSCNDKASDDIFAGKTDHAFFIDLNPDIDLTYPKMKDSIDIDQDSLYEIFLELLPFPLSTGYTTLPAIRSTSNLNILLADDNMPDALSLGDFIDNSAKWSKSDTLIRLVNIERISQNDYRTYGHWIHQQDKYLGIKYKNRLGWIKISTSPSYIIKEIAIEE
jgi:hypothetical protein